MLVKICGATSAGDVALLDTAGADLVGLWHGIPGGHADLPLRALSALAAAAQRTARLKPVLVTFLDDVGVLHETMATAGLRWVQLHGYQPPGTVRALKSGADLTVVKVLHLGADGCVERPLIPSYERAGTDLFLLDAVAADGRVGSTAQQLDGNAVLDIADRMTRPFLLAGGISAANRRDYQAVPAHPLFLGVDVDTAARGPGGGLRADRVAAVRRGWRAADGTEAAT